MKIFLSHSTWPPHSEICMNTHHCIIFAVVRRKQQCNGSRGAISNTPLTLFLHPSNTLRGILTHRETNKAIVPEKDTGRSRNWTPGASFCTTGFLYSPCFLLDGVSKVSTLWAKRTFLTEASKYGAKRTSWVNKGGSLHKCLRAVPTVISISSGLLPFYGKRPIAVADALLVALVVVTTLCIVRKIFRASSAMDLMQKHSASLLTWKLHRRKEV